MRLLVALGALAFVITATPACDKKKDEAKKEEPKKKDGAKKDEAEAKKEEPKKEEPKKEEPKAAEGDKKEEPKAAEGDKKEEPKAAEGDKKEEPKAAEAAGDLPAACAKMKKCIDAMGAKMPAAKGAYDKAWGMVVTALKGPGKDMVVKTCEQSLKGYGASPTAPAECK